MTSSIFRQISLLTAHTHALSLSCSFLHQTDFYTNFHHELSGPCCDAHFTGQSSPAHKLDFLFSWGTQRGAGKWDSGSVGESEIRNEARGRWRGQELGEFLWMLHSRGTSDYIRSDQSWDQTGTDKTGRGNKESDLGSSLG